MLGRKCALQLAYTKILCIPQGRLNQLEHQVTSARISLPFRKAARCTCASNSVLVLLHRDSAGDHFAPFGRNPSTISIALPETTNNLLVLMARCAGRPLDDRRDIHRPGRVRRYMRYHRTVGTLQVRQVRRSRGVRHLAQGRTRRRTVKTPSLRAKRSNSRTRLLTSPRSIAARLGGFASLAVTFAQAMLTPPPAGDPC